MLLLLIIEHMFDLARKYKMKGCREMIKVNKKEFWGKIKDMEEQFVNNQLYLNGYAYDDNSLYIAYIRLLWGNVVRFSCHKRIEEFTSVDFCIVMGMATRMIKCDLIKMDKPLTSKIQDYSKGSLLTNEIIAKAL